MWANILHNSITESLSCAGSQSNWSPSRLFAYWVCLSMMTAYIYPVSVYTSGSILYVELNKKRKKNWKWKKKRNVTEVVVCSTWKWVLMLLLLLSVCQRIDTQDWQHVVVWLKPLIDMSNQPTEMSTIQAKEWWISMYQIKSIKMQL